MRRLVMFMLFLSGGLILGSCDATESPNPLEPSFGKLPRGCQLSETQQGVIQLIRDGIDLLFDERNARKAAHGHIDNILREVCRGDYASARSQLHSFIQQVEGQPEEKLTEYREDWANLVSWAIILATDPETIAITIPPGAFEPTGSLGILDPTNYVLWTANGEAAVETDPGNTYDPFIMAISRVPDGLVDGLLGTTWPTAPPGYQIAAENASPPGGAVVAVCIYEDFLTYLDLPEMDADETQAFLGGLVLGHGGTGGVEVLEVEDLPVGFACSADPTPYPGTQAVATGPGWIQSIGRLAGAMVRKVVGLEPLHARRFAGRGLAGRTGSFSPFAPVYPYSLSVTGPSGPILMGQSGTGEATLTIAQPGSDPAVTSCDECTWAVDPAGVVQLDPAAGGAVTVTGLAIGTATVTAIYPGLRASFTVEVIPAEGDLVVDLNITPVSPGALVPENGWTIELLQDGAPVTGFPSMTTTLPDGTVTFADLPWGSYAVRIPNRDFDVTFTDGMTQSVAHSYPGHPNGNSVEIKGVQQAVRDGVKIYRIADGGNGNAYEYVHGGKAWNAVFNAILDPESDLLGVQGHMVTIADGPENAFVASFFLTSPDLCPGIDLSTCDDMAWVGLNDNAEETFFFWVTGEALGSYQPWAPGHPGDSEHNEDYVEIDARGEWSTVNGASSTNDGYVVEFEVPGNSNSGT